jgi:hypothetical protein
VRFLISDDMGSFLDKRKVLRRFVSCRGNQDRDVSLVWFLFVRRARLVLGVGVYFWRVFFGGGY